MSTTPRRASKASSTRKPYVITKKREPWTDAEHEKFVEALSLYERDSSFDWKKMAEHVGKRTVKQLRSHAQKYFMKLKKAEEDSYAKVSQKAPKPTKRPRERYDLRDLADRKVVQLLIENTPTPTQPDGPVVQEPSPDQSMVVFEPRKSEADVPSPKFAELCHQMSIASAAFVQLQPQSVSTNLLNALTIANQGRLADLRAQYPQPEVQPEVQPEADSELLSWFHEQMGSVPYAAPKLNCQNPSLFDNMDIPLFSLDEDDNFGVSGMLSNHTTVSAPVSISSSNSSSFTSSEPPSPTMEPLSSIDFAQYF